MQASDFYPELRVPTSGNHLRAVEKEVVPQDEVVVRAWETWATVCRKIAGRAS